MTRRLASRILLAAACIAMSVPPAAIAQDLTPEYQPGPSNAVDPIDGLWSSQVTITNCKTGDVMRSFKALNLFSRGGSVLDTDSQPPYTHGPGFGVWSRITDSEYTSTFELFRYNSDGSFAGTQLIVRNIALASDGQSFSSIISVNILDATDHSLGSACGTEEATRPQVN